jgi:hypothetical protein
VVSGGGRGGQRADRGGRQGGRRWTVGWIEADS